MVGCRNLRKAYNGHPADFFFLLFVCCVEGDKIVSAPYLFKAELLRKSDETTAHGNLFLKKGKASMLENRPCAHTRAQQC